MASRRSRKRCAMIPDDIKALMVARKHAEGALRDVMLGVEGSGGDIRTTFYEQGLIDAFCEMQYRITVMLHARGGADKVEEAKHEGDH